MTTTLDGVATLLESLPRKRGKPLFGPLIIRRLIQRGGMAAVFEASPQQEPRRRVALKCLLPELANDPEQFARFQLEARLLRRLDHPKIVRALSRARVLTPTEAGPPQIHYFVMEFVDGSNLADRLDAGAPLPLDEVRAVALEILEGLAHLHDQGLVHRDLTLSNVLVGKDGTVKLIDLGLAKNLVEPEDGRTEKWGAMGKSGFIPPERPSEATPAYDLFTFGATLYYLLVGKGPTGFSRMASPPWLRPTPFDDLATHRPDAGDLVELVTRCTARNPSDRHADAHAALAALTGTEEVTPDDERSAPEEHTQPFRTLTPDQAHTLPSEREMVPVAAPTMPSEAAFTAAMTALSEAHRRLGDTREAERVRQRLETLLGRGAS